MFAWPQSFICLAEILLKILNSTFCQSLKCTICILDRSVKLKWSKCIIYTIFTISALSPTLIGYHALFLASNCKSKIVIFVKIEIFEIVRYFSDQKQTKMGIILSWTLFIIKSYHWCASKNDHKCYNSLPRITGRVRQECNKVIDMQLFNTQTTKGKKLSFVHSKKQNIPYVVKLSWHGRAIECYHRRSSMRWVWLYYRILIRLS